jgi:RNA polymerase sigma factor (sigma-70 family)
MGTQSNDWDLLREYAQTRREEPFARLAVRYGDMVYATALRATRGRRTELAEDVTQAVFIILSRRAGDLKQTGSLAGWLHRTARFTVMNVLRAEVRRSRHERAAARAERLSDAKAPNDDERAAFFDQAFDRLRRSDRQILAIHYLEEKTMNQTAETLGLSTEAARKRLSRALDRLRALAGARNRTAPGIAETVAAMQSLAVAPVAARLIAVGSRAGGERGVSIAHQTLRAIRLKRWTMVAAGASGIAAIIAVSVIALPILRAAASAPVHMAATRPTASAPATQAAAEPNGGNIQCMRNLRDLTMAIMMYQNAHKRQFPPDLGSTLSELLSAPEGRKSGAKAYICPLDMDKVGPVPDQVTPEWINQHTSYIYLGDPKIDVRKLPPGAWEKTAIVYEPPEAGHPREPEGRLVPVAMLDGHVENMTVHYAEKVIAESKKTLEAASSKK